MVIRDLSQQGPCNRGGGYVTGYCHDPAPGGHVLSVSGPRGAVDQVRLADPAYTLRGSAAQRYCLKGVGSHPSPETTAILELLTGVLTVPCGGSLDFAIALDWFNKLVDGEVADLTDLADLVHRGKHVYTPLGDVENLREAGGAVADEIAEVLGHHPLLRNADAIAAPPGHDSKVPGFGARLAAGVAKRRDTPLVRCTSRQELRAQARSLAFPDRAPALAGQFHCADDVSGQHIVIVDDVYASGATAEETARALRAAGASRVVSIAAIRTMEFEPSQVTKEFAEERLLADLALARTAGHNGASGRPDDDDWTV